MTHRIVTARALVKRALVAALLGVRALAAQDANIFMSVPRIETLLRDSAFKPVAAQGSRFKGDRTEHVLLAFSESTAIEVKWAVAARGGEAFNNQPRYEAAAYELQKLFLDERDLVVPPTVLRMVPQSVFAESPGLKGEPTFDDGQSVLVALQYWTAEVTPEGVFDEKRAKRDSVYARHLGDLNILTYLIRHRDANKGNMLISADTANPRLFAVDNGVAFNSPPSNRGADWQYMRVKRVSAGTAARLKSITDSSLTSALGVVAQFERRGDDYVPAAPGPNLDRDSGVRRQGSTLQLGLTAAEIDGVRDRLKELVEDIEKGKIKTF
jgi:hypothetical protein